MNQKEIMQQMSTCPWACNGATYSFSEYTKLGRAKGWDIYHGDWTKPKVITGIIPPNDCNYTNTTSKTLKETEANAEAIVQSVNATYGNNIDPEQVKPMYDMLKGLAYEMKLSEVERNTILALIEKATL